MSLRCLFSLQRNGFRKGRIVMVSPCGGGGIRTVVETLIASSLFQKGEWEWRWVCSHIEAPLWQRLQTAFMAYLEIFVLLLLPGPVLLHLHASAHGSFFRKSILIWMARCLHRPIILHMHSSSFRSFYEAIPSWIRAYVRLTMNQSTQVIALSEGWARYYQSITQSPIEVIPNFLLDSYHQDPFSASGDQILFLGRYGSRKGIYDLIEAVGSLVKTFPSLHLNCAGDGEIALVREMIRLRGLERHITVNGWLEGSEKQVLFRSSSIFVLPSHAEGLPMALLEAMAQGLAIVASKVGGIPEVIDDAVTGLLVPASDITALKTAMARLLEDPDLRRRLGRSARDCFLAHYSERAVVTKFQVLYRRLLLDDQSFRA